MSRLRSLFVLVALALAGCNPDTTGGAVPDDASVDVDAAVDTDAAIPDAPPDAPPVAPPGEALETATSAGRVTSGTFSFDVVVGGTARGRTADGTRTLDTAPTLR
jgi:hypothetical protein